MSVQSKKVFFLTFGCHSLVYDTVVATPLSQAWFPILVDIANNGITLRVRNVNVTLLFVSSLVSHEAYWPKHQK